MPLDTGLVDTVIAAAIPWAWAFIARASGYGQPRGFGCGLVMVSYGAWGVVAREARPRWF
jgi:hypothetical protein